MPRYDHVLAIIFGRSDPPTRLYLKRNHSNVRVRTVRMKNYILPILTACIYTNVQAEPFDVFQDCDVCPEMVEMPLGDFLMGAPKSEYASTPFYLGIAGDPPDPRAAEFFLIDEGPVHPVEIDVPFAIGRNEVTYDQWIACVSDGGCNGYAPDPTILTTRADERSGPVFQAIGNHPVMRISYLDAVAYTEWLNLKTGTEAYRLPTEAEWEYAARAGTKTMFAQGDDITPDQASFDHLIQADEASQLPPETIVSGLPVPVEELDAANPWGLRHMSGNISELTSTCLTRPYEMWARSSTYLEETNNDSSCRRSVRGGAFSTPRHSTRVAARISSFDDKTRFPSVGFRVVRNLSD